MWCYLSCMKWQRSPVFLPGKFHGQRSLVDYHPWGCKESDTTERLNTSSLLKPPSWKCKPSYLYIYIAELFVRERTCISRDTTFQTTFHWPSGLSPLRHWSPHNLSAFSVITLPTDTLEHLSTCSLSSGCHTDILKQIFRQLSYCGLWGNIIIDGQ